MDDISSQQYALGVEIGRLVLSRLLDGMTYDEVRATLCHSLKLVEFNAAIGLDFRSIPQKSSGDRTAADILRATFTVRA